MIEWLNNNDGFIFAALTFVYVVATIVLVCISQVQVKIANKNLRFNTELEKQRTRPYVIFDMVIKDLVIRAVLKNYGRTPAIDVKLVISPKISTEISGKERESPFSEHGVALLVPGREIEDPFGFGVGFFKQYPTPIFNGHVSYADQDGNKYNEEFRIDLNYTGELLDLSSDSKVAEELQQIRMCIDRVTRQFGPPLIRTIDESKYRKEFEEDNGIQLRPKKKASNKSRLRTLLRRVRSA